MRKILVFLKKGVYIGNSKDTNSSVFATENSMVSATKHCASENQE